MDKKDKGPRYKLIYSQLLQYFSDNQFEVDQKVPSEFNLMDRFGVSRTTVRKALSLLEEKGVISRSRGSGTFYRGLVKEDTVQREAKGFIGLVNYFFMDYIYTEILRGIEDEITRSGYSLVLANSNRDSVKQAEVVERLIEEGVKGLILEPSSNLDLNEQNVLVKVLNNSNIPVVTTHWAIHQKKLSTVTLDDAYAGYNIAQYLISKGHKDLAIVYKSDVQAGFDRNKGFTQALAESGIPLPPQWDLSYNERDEQLEPLQGYELTSQIFRQEGRKPSAIFFMNDRLALEGYKALYDLGYSIPDDVSIVGFDDHKNAAMSTPGLTTFMHPKYDLGRWSARILIDEIENRGTILPMKLVFEPVLIERESVKDLTSID